MSPTARATNGAKSGFAVFSVAVMSRMPSIRRVTGWTIGCP